MRRQVRMGLVGGFSDPHGSEADPLTAGGRSQGGGKLARFVGLADRRYRPPCGEWNGLRRWKCVLNLQVALNGKQFEFPQEELIA